MTTRLDVAIRGLGKYFNVIDKTTFVSMLVNDADPTDVDLGEDDTMDIPPEIEVAKLFLDLTEGGVLTPQFIERMKEAFEGANTEEKIEMMKTLWLTYEGDVSNGVDFESDSLPILPFDSPWLANRGEAAGSMLNVCGLADIEGSVINSAPAAPDKTAPAISTYCIIPPNLNIANRDTGAVSLFMTSIPTIEMSRCVPFLDITLITPKSPLSGDGRIQTMSLMQFLMGQAQLEDGSINNVLASAVSTEVLSEFEEQQAGAEEEEAEEGEEQPGIASAGMEMFTSPQTLVPADEDFHDYEAYQTITTTSVDESGTETTEDSSVGSARGAGIIDKFRPFMSVKGMSINVAPSTGFMSYKTAKMSLILHDRSRLSEVAPFVKPDLYGSTELLIEYGWSHPDGGPQSENDFGVLLDSMRVKEKYMIVNSSFKFDEVGQVEIDVQLAMKGSADFDTTSISKGAGVEEALEAVNSLTEAIAVLRSKVMGDSGGSEDVSGSTVLSSASDTSRSMSIDDETRQKIVDYISSNRDSTDPDISDLTDNLTSLYGEDGQSGAIADLQDTIAAAVAAKLTTISGTTATGDPWLPYITSAQGFVSVNKDRVPPKFVSLAKLLNVFCGVPLAATGKFDEIQFIYYAFNSQASYVKDLNIAQFPIKIEEFEKEFKEKTKTSANIPIKSFLGFVRSSFITNQAAYPWGLSDLYEADEEGNVSLKEDYEDATALYSEKQMRLEDAYGVADNGGASLEFKQPKLEMYIETVRVNDDEVSGPTGSATGGAAQTILRIHIFDKQTSSYESLGAMLSAARADQMGTLGNAASATRTEPDEDDPTTTTAEHQQDFADQIQAAIDSGLIEALPSVAGATAGSVSIEDFAETKFRIKGGFAALKKFISDTMPCIIYGSQNSAVIKANLSSMNNPQLASVNMMRAGMGAGTTAQGARDAGVPLQVSPTQLSMDIFGCPLVNFGQQFFVDFNTGTTVDNIYTVTGIDHKIESGKFETSLKLVQVDAFGKYTSMIGNVEDALAMIAESEAGEEEEA